MPQQTFKFPRFSSVYWVLSVCPFSSVLEVSEPFLFWEVEFFWGGGGIFLGEQREKMVPGICIFSGVYSFSELFLRIVLANNVARLWHFNFFFVPRKFSS